MDDLISRQAAIELVKDVCDAIMSECKSHYDSEVGDEVYDDTLEVDAILKCNKGIRIALRDMPSAQPERKTGKWIYEGVRGRFPACRCSVCENVENADWAMISGEVNYCPNCGAKMDWEGENDDN